MSEELTDCAASMANFAAGVAGGTQPDFTLDVNVTDSQGGGRKIELAFLKTATANTWHVEAYAIPATDVNTVGATVGLMYTDREFDGSFNRIGGVDGSFKWKKNYFANFQLLESSTQDLR